MLQLVHSNEGGGVEALAEMISDGLRQSGADVETRFIYPNISATTAQKLRGIASAISAIVRKRPDTLIAYQSTASVLVGIVGTIVGCKKRIVHQTAMPGEIHPAVRAIDTAMGSAGLYSVNIANSAATEHAFGHYPRAYRKYLRRIDHGLDAPVARYPRAAVLARYAIPDDGLLLLNAGRLCDQKGQDQIIRALPHVRAARLILAGGGPNEASLRELARSLGVADRIHFLGVVSRDALGDLLGAVDMFVFPSKWETFGLAAVEAAMAGVPIVAADLPVLREVLSTGGEQLVGFVGTDDPRALAEAIEKQRALNRTSDAIRDFTQSIRAKYSRSRMLESYAELVTGTEYRRAG
ncbi:glycosyltransferase family 4 protein [Hyphomicrobium sp. 99]|uniref:glycosyltransferase family 4 protein n=1 Tax=Hyphomicrobium sp. 99 TaxID=1163419 RepID=UPI0018CF7D38|nr:glycosyltransferase family 4 protein [Hyphomicrobium sp. 99]